MAKKIVGFIKLQIPAGKANPSPPVGPALGQRGLNIMEFCKAFNAQTSAGGFEPGMKLPVVITAFADKSFTFIIKSPPVGPALGQRGLNIMEFCKAFNAQTQGVEPGLPLPVVITAFADKSFTFIIKTPPATVLIKKAVKLDKGSSSPLANKVGKITRAQLEEIAKTKMKDMNAASVDAAIRTLAGSARSMGITVEGI